MIREQILPLFDANIRNVIEQASIDFHRIQEIRLRIGRPLIFVCKGEEFYLSEQGSLSDQQSNVICADERVLKEILERACGYSGYAFEEEICRGYLTIAGGHRIGLAGRAVMTKQGVQTLKYISSLNIRIAHSVPGCAEAWREYFYRNGHPCHLLIISSPGGGKTTLLRDVIRNFSDGTGKFQGVTVGVADERSEIAGSFRGKPSFDLGSRTDVLDGCPKTLGMEMLLRSMAPQVLAADEIGTADVPAIENVLRCGSKLAATLHGDDIRDFLKKPGFERLVKERVFERYIILKSGQAPGLVKKIYDQDFQIIWEDKECMGK